MSAFPPVVDYGLVGDGHSAALVSSHGDVEWWCPQRFDSPSVFARLLDRAGGGHLTTGATIAYRREVSYVGESNVHRVELVTAQGRARVTTFMPHAEARHPRGDARRLVRIVECVEGDMEVRVEVAPRFDYARVTPDTEATAGGVAFRAGGDTLDVRATMRLEVREHDARARVHLQEGEAHALVLTWNAEGPEDPLSDARDAFARELRFWKEWMSHCGYEGAYAQEARRSMLALKLMQHVPTGAFVAAPTLGLPEIPGMGENWDYRYSWLRDGAFIVMAFETMGFDDEALRFRRWLADVVKRDSPEHMQTLYRVDGGRDVPESTLQHLEGYERSRPVYLGNKAVEQHQLDTYGETMMCFHRADEVFDEQGEQLWPALRALVQRVADTWRDPDSGIWELRAAKRNYVYSKAMAWLAVRHGIDVARDHGYDAPLDEWERAARDIRAWTEEHGFDEKRGGYRQSAERGVPDAATFLLPILGYSEPDDARITGSLDWTTHVLASHDLVHRHLHEDNAGSEGAFLPASFWLAYDHAQAGRPDEARRWFDAALDVAGPLGLLPEEADAATRAGLGNHPQALTHLALVLAAWAIDDAESPGSGERGRASTRTRGS